MASKRIIGDAKDEIDPKDRAKSNRDWEVKNLDKSKPDTLGASHWNTNPAVTPGSRLAPAPKVWKMGETRKEIFAKIEKVGGGGRGKLSAPQRMSLEDAARRRAYENLYASGKFSETSSNVEYLTDLELWTGNVKTRTSEEMPWKQPEHLKVDEGYAAFVKKSGQRSKWTNTVLADDTARRVQGQKEHAELEADLKAKGKTIEDLAPPIIETHNPTSEGQDGVRVVGEALKMMHVGTAPSPTKQTAAVPAAVPAAPVAKAQEAVVVAKKNSLWTVERMSEFYKETFGETGTRLDGMGGFQLPFEPELAPLVTRKALKEAAEIFPACVELRPVNLGWGRVKLCLQFLSWVSRDRADFTMQRFSLIWSWFILVRWKKTLLPKKAAGSEKAEEPPLSMYDGIRAVLDRWTDLTVDKLVVLSEIGKAWKVDIEADASGLDDEASKQRLQEAVFKVLASSREQDDEKRACAVVDWAETNPEKFTAGGRTRANLAIQAMCKYCETETGEEKLGKIAQVMASEEHKSPGLMKILAAETAKAN